MPFQVGHFHRNRYGVLHFAPHTEPTDEILQRKEIDGHPPYTHTEFLYAHRIPSIMQQNKTSYGHIPDPHTS